MNFEEQNSVYYLEKAPVSKAIAHMCIPMMLGMVINMVYSITNAFYIGLLNDTAKMAVITLALPFTTILMAIGNIFGVGGSTYISRLLGEKDKEGSKRASSVNFYLSMFSGIIFIIICLSFLSPVLQLLGSTGETLAHTKDYIIVFAIGSPFVIANFTLEQTIRGEGASKVAMIGMFISVLVNMVLDPLLIFVLHLDVMGAAIATVIGTISAVCYYAYYLKKKSPVQSVDFNYFKPDKEILTNIFKVGISAFLLDGFLIVSSLMFNNYAMKYGDYVVAGFGVAQRVVQLSDLVGMGLYMGVVPLIAFAYSSGDNQRLKEVIRKTATYLIVFTLSVAIVLFIFRTNVLKLFSTDNSMIFTGTYILTTLLTSTLFACFSGLFTGIFQAFGKGIQSTVMSVARGIALIPIIMLCDKWLGLDGVVWSLTASEVLACIIGLTMWFGLRRKLAVV